MSKFSGIFFPPTYGPVFKSLVRKGQLLYRLKNKKILFNFNCICQYIIIPSTAVYTAVDPNAIFPLFPLIFIRDMTSYVIILQKLIWTFDVKKIYWGQKIKGSLEDVRRSYVSMSAKDIQL